MLNERRRWTGIAIALAAALAAPAAPQVQAGGPALEPETKDRITGDALAALTEELARLVDARRIRQAEAAFEELLARQPPRTAAVSDHLTSFGLALFGADDMKVRRRSVGYFRRAAEAARATFGPDHPEYALTLATFADAQTALWPDDPPREADAALAEAYRIRLAALGSRNIETIASLIDLAEIRGLPSRTGGHRDRIDAAAALYREAVRTSDNRRGAAYSYDFNDFAIHLRLAAMYGRNGIADAALASANDASVAFRATRREGGNPCSTFASRASRIDELLRDGGRKVLADQLNPRFERALRGCPRRLF